MPSTSFDCLQRGQRDQRVERLESRRSLQRMLLMAPGRHPNLSVYALISESVSFNADTGGERSIRSAERCGHNALHHLSLRWLCPVRLQEPASASKCIHACTLHTSSGQRRSANNFTRVARTKVRARSEQRAQTRLRPCRLTRGLDRCTLYQTHTSRGSASQARCYSVAAGLPFTGVAADAMVVFVTWVRGLKTASRLRTKCRIRYLRRSFSWVSDLTCDSSSETRASNSACVSEPVSPSAFSHDGSALSSSLTRRKRFAASRSRTTRLSDSVCETFSPGTVFVPDVTSILALVTISRSSGFYRKIGGTERTYTHHTTTAFRNSNVVAGGVQ
jgi:hypothetical protein